MEPRFKAAVLYVAGLDARESEALPEEALKNFLPRVHQPVLVLSGEYDNVMPLETSAKPFVELLGTPAAGKTARDLSGRSFRAARNSDPRNVGLARRASSARTH